MVLHSLYEDVHHYCANYRTEEKADYSVVITQADIDREREISKKTFADRGENFIHSPDSYLEELAVYRKIADRMIEYDTVLFHGSAVAVDGQTYLFGAKSGTGKSTHTQLWREYFGDRAVMMNDDKPLIHIGETITVYGTPYNGKHRLGSNIACPLKAICFLTRSETNHIERLSDLCAYPLLLSQVHQPEGVFKTQKLLKLIDTLLKRVRFYRLGCNTDISAAKISYEGMQ